VSEVFSSVAPRYDLMNDLMSGGLHRLWKDRLVDKLRPFPGMRHLDVAGGTGDIAFRVLREIERREAAAGGSAATSASGAALPGGSVTICDINPGMLAEGRKKAQSQNLDPTGARLEWREGNAEALDFEDNTYDAYTIAFGIRNVTHVDRALAEAHRVLRRGGRFLCLEFSHVSLPLLKQVYDAYSFHVIPQLGRAVAGDAKSYEYLVESIRKFPEQERFKGMIEAAGFRAVSYENLSGGIVAIHSGFKL
jgi:2-methoxy-6-polyprenyl-1,4-benzoquinol methylase